MNEPSPMSNSSEINWRESEISEIASINHSRIDPADSPETKFELYSFSAYDEGKIPETTKGEDIGSAKYEITEPGVLLSKLNPRINRVWKVENPPKNAICSTEFVILTPSEPELLDFLYSICVSLPFRDYLQSFTTGTSTSHQRVRQSDILDYECEVPELTYASKAGRALTSFEKKIKTETKIEELLLEIGRELYRYWFKDFGPYSEFKESELGSIPKQFDCVNLTNLCEVTYGYSFDSSKFREDTGGTPVVRIRDLSSGETETRTPEEFAPKYAVDPGDILVSMDGEFDSYVWTGRSAALNQRVCKFSSAGTVSDLYIYYTLEEPLSKLEQTKTGTTVIHLGKGDIEKIKCVRPDPESLEKFNNISNSIHDYIVGVGSEIRTLEQLRETLLPKILSGEVELST